MLYIKNCKILTIKIKKIEYKKRNLFNYNFFINHFKVFLGTKSFIIYLITITLIKGYL